MNYSEVLEKYLYRIARDELSDTVSVLPLFKKAKVFVLGKFKSKDLDANISSQSLENISLVLPIYNKNEKLLLPVFLQSQRPSQPQPNENFEFIEILGESLLSVLPDNYGIIIEPMTSLEVIFTADTLIEYFSSRGHVSLVDNTTVDSLDPKNELFEKTSIDEQDKDFKNDSKIRYLRPVEVKVEAENSKAKNFEAEHFSLFDKPDNDFYNDSYIEDDDKIRLSPRKKTASKENISNIRSAYDLEERLIELLSRFDSVSEAYLLPHNTEHSECVLGVLSESWSSDERFQLAEQIAKVSQDFYSYAGGIEVYDDLHDTHSKSWELFKMIPPFYSKEIGVTTYQPLNSDIEISESKLVSPIEKIKKSGFKFFGR